MKKAFQNPGSPKKKSQAKSSREEAERIRKSQRDKAIQCSQSSLPTTSIQAQSSEADEHYSYLDPQNLGEPQPDPDYPIREVEEEECYSYFAPPIDTEPPSTPPFQMSYVTPTPGPIAGPSSAPAGQGTGVTAAIQAAINAAIAGLQPQNDGKNYRLPDQNTFSGRAETVDAFLLECVTRFNILPNNFNSTNKKVYYALSLMKDGVARTWKEQYLRSREGEQYLAEQNLWDNFANRLKTSFTDPGNRTNAMRSLKNICQGNGSIDELNTRFRLLISKAGLDITQNAALLVQMYEDAINP